ncbi:MAG: endolytic transglycosylase MltG [Polyangiaceae bacterium]|nr:endolytic transglycosylase MltG [Polyangiaceae bacterium]
MTRARAGWALAAGLAVLAILTGAWLALAITSGGLGSGKRVRVDVAPGEAPRALADRLAKAGVVRSAWRFSAYSALFGDASALAAGPHWLRDDLSARELRARLERRAGVPREKVTFPEGFNRFDMARRLGEKGVCEPGAFLAATVDADLLRDLGVPGASAEGYLFPATYALADDADPREIVRRMKAEFDHRVERLRASYPDFPGAAARELGFTRHQVLTLASMVEKEAQAPEERPLVASVFFNRFRDPGFLPKPPRLQSDPTSAYGCLVDGARLASCAGFTGKVTAEMVHDPENRWGTYRNGGLPPGPICNPGERSIAAAVQPADTRYLYFVARGGGKHTFSATLAEHNAAVERLREGRR